MKIMMAAWLIGILLITLHMTALAEQTANKQYKYKRSAIAIEVNGHTLQGILYQPKNTDGDVPLVICSHGYTDSQDRFLYLCDKLARRGIACAAFDFYGGSAYSASGGSMTEMSTDTEQADLDAVVEALKSRDGIDAARVCLLGHSQGGFVSTLEATRCPEKVYALFLYAPAFHIPETMTAMFPDTANLPERTQIGTGSIGPDYILAVWGMDIYAEMEKFAGPVRIVHGDRDDAADVSYSERAVAAFPDAELTVLSGVDHNLTDNVTDVLVEKILQILVP